MLALCNAAAAAADRHTAYMDPAEAGPDFEVQGEYIGEIQTDEGKVAWGAQIVSRGDGKFVGVGYRGGLPGAGWDKSETVSAEGETKGGVTTFVHDDGRQGIIKDGTITIQDADGKQVGTLRKVDRKSPTLGAKPPSDAVVLFDGTSPDAFNPSIRRTPKHQLMTDDGLLREGIDSKRKFQSFTIHLEFRTPFMPYAKGQGRGNSGFYAQGRYEVQILDSFGLESRSGDCGGIYSVAPPNVNMCLPPLSWQTYDVDFTAAEFDPSGKKVRNARMTVRHNGVLVHDDIEVPRATPSCIEEESPGPGPIHLQNHGNPVRFRNIWLVKKK
jgi:hypothetical protein